MKPIKKYIYLYRFNKWGKKLLKEYGERFRYFAIFFYSNDGEVGITVAYDDTCFSVMNLEKIKNYNEFSVRACLSFSKSYNETQRGAFK